MDGGAWWAAVHVGRGCALSRLGAELELRRSGSTGLFRIPPPCPRLWMQSRGCPAQPGSRAGAGTTRPPSGCEAQAGRAQVHWWASHSLCSQSAWQDTPLPPRFPECHLSQPFQEPACDWQQTTAHSSSRGNTGQDRTLAGAAWPCPGPFVSCTGYPRDGCWWPRRRPPRPQARVSPSQTLEGAGTRGAGCRVPSGREGKLLLLNRFSRVRLCATP